MLRIKIDTASAEIIENDLITAGRKGLECQFVFSSDWDNLAKTVVIHGAVKRDWSLVGNSMVIPGECLAREQYPLKIGVYGANANGDIVIPTIWTNFGKILPSAQPSGIDPDEVTPNLVAQIEQNSANALYLAQQLTNRANSGEFDGEDGAPGPRGPQGVPGQDGAPGSFVYSVTPEDYGAVGDGVTDDTTAVQAALNSGFHVVMEQTYKVTSVTAKNVNVTLTGKIIGQLAIENNANVSGGTIQQTTDDACVIIRSTAESGRGYVNSSIQNAKLVPTSAGIGLELFSDSNALFGYYANNLDIASCNKSIYIYNNKWLTKGAIENVYCHTPTYAIFIDNLKATNTYCGDIVFRNVFAQYYDHKPLNFFKLNQGNCLVSLYDCFCYDGVEEYIFAFPGDVAATRVSIFGPLKNNPTSNQFSSNGSLRFFQFYPQYVDGTLYVKASLKNQPGKDYYGGAYLENFNSPALSSSRFFGLVGRGGMLQGDSEPNKVFGVSFYDGRLSLLRSTDGTVSSGNVFEVTTPYSGAVYTTATLPANARSGATCFCSDTMEFMTYYGGQWNRVGPSPFVVTYTAASGATATCDKTYAQIMVALQAKQEVLAFYVASNSVAAQLTTVAIDTNNSDILFTNAQNGGVTTLRHKSDGTITVSSNDGYVFRDQGSANAGKVLKVGNDGTVAPETAAEPLIVTYTATSATTATCDKTYAQIVAAMQSKQEVIAFFAAGNAVGAQLTSIGIDQNNAALVFTIVTGDFNTMLMHYPDGTIYSTTTELLLKDQGVIKAGKILKVGNTGIVTPETVSASDVGAVSSNQGSNHAGEFLVVGNDGNVTTMTLAAWQGGSF